MKKQICVVCFANYCRSPAAEVILSNLYSSINFISAGLSPVPKANMDPRSSNFLLNRNYKFKLHSPKKISEKIIRDSELIYAIDFSILMSLNKKFPSYSEKIKLITHQTPKINLMDPYKMTSENYMEIMKNLEIVCKSIKIDI